MRSELRYALRLCRRRPGFTAAAVLTLALGIGVTTAVCAVVHGVLFRPLPVTDDERVVAIYTATPRQDLFRRAASGARFEEWRQRADVFTDMAAVSRHSFDLRLGGVTERVEGELVSGNFFELLGVQPAHGRIFTGADEQRVETGVVCVISEDLWRRHFAADPGVLGQTITAGDDSMTIVGVVPQRFARWRSDGLLEAPRVGIWVPYRLVPGLLPPSRFNSDGYRMMRVLARLRPDVSVDLAGEQMAIVDARVDEVFGDPEPEHDVAVVGIRELMVDGPTRRSLWLVALTALLVLALAAANVAGQILAQSVPRQRELATRAAVGATRLRLVRQMVVESGVLGVGGACGGVLLAAWIVPLLMAFAPVSVAAAADVSIDATAWLFAIGAMLVTTLATSILPALRSRRWSILDGLRGSGGITSRPDSIRAQALLIVAQMAVVMPLATLAGLMATSFARLQAIDTGLAEPRHLLTMTLSRQQLESAGPMPADWYALVLERIAAVPGVETGAVGSVAPVGYLYPQAPDSGVSITIEGVGRFLNGVPEQAALTPTHRRVTAEYLQTLGLPVIVGRDISAADRAGAAPAAVVNETMAALHWPGESPIGKRVNFENVRAGRPLPAPWIEIVGVVADARHHRYDAPPRPEIYTALAQAESVPSTVTLLVRGSVTAASLAAAARRAVHEADPAVAVFNVQTMAGIIEEATATPRYATQLVTLFGVVAMVLAAVGIHGLGSFVAAQRVREIGIRVALGATRTDVLKMILVKGLRPAAAGVVAGGLAAALATRFVGALLYETEPLDPVVFAVATIVLLLVAAAAAYVPARRATRVDPVVALRAE